jgi:hypothetical protein
MQFFGRLPEFVVQIPECFLPFLIPKNSNPGRLLQGSVF